MNTAFKFLNSSDNVNTSVEESNMLTAPTSQYLRMLKMIGVPPVSPGKQREGSGSGILF